MMMLLLRGYNIGTDFLSEWSDEAIEKQKMINEMKIELLELAKGGWDISYTETGVSGYEASVTVPELR